jgi:hypothetical protein
VVWPAVTNARDEREGVQLLHVLQVAGLPSFVQPGFAIAAVWGKPEL